MIKSINILDELPNVFGHIMPNYGSLGLQSRHSLFHWLGHETQPWHLLFTGFIYVFEHVQKAPAQVLLFSGTPFSKPMLLL